MGKTIGVVSLKGGVGKTSVVAALGAAMADFNKKILLVDSNFSAPDLGIHLNIVDPETTLHHVFNKTAHMKDAVQKLDQFDFIPSSIFTNTLISPLRFKSHLSHIKRGYDHVLLDSSPSLGEETLAVMLASDSILVVTTPDHPTLSATLKAIKLAKQRGTCIDGLILNKVYNKDFELSLNDVQNTVEVPVMAVIPHDLDVLRALSHGIPSTRHKPKSPASQEYKKLAATLIGEKYKSPKLKKWFRWINPKKQEVNRDMYYSRVFG